MLDPDVTIKGFTAVDWQRLVGVFTPPAGVDSSRSDEPRGTVFAVHDRRGLRKLTHSEVGRLRLTDAEAIWPMSAKELAWRHHASRAVKIERGALEDVMEYFGARVRRQDDLTAQVRLLWSLVGQQQALGRLEIWPPIGSAPLPRAAKIDRALDLLCPAGTVLLLGLFEREELWTSLALRRGSSGFDRVLGPDGVRQQLAQHGVGRRALARAVQRRLGKLSFGCFAEAKAFRDLSQEPSPGAWLRGVARRDVVLSPLSPLALIPLGVDGWRGAIHTLRAAIQRVADREALAVDLLSLRRR